jgi:hypothetical protein
MKSGKVMLALLRKFAAWIGLSASPAAVAVSGMATPTPGPAPAAPPWAARRSGRHASPLATRRERRSGRSQPVVLAAAKPPARKTSCRPKSASPMPRRAPPPRCVRLVSRFPELPGPVAAVIALPTRRRRAGMQGLRVLAAA